MRTHLYWLWVFVKSHKYIEWIFTLDAQTISTCDMTKVHKQKYHTDKLFMVNKNGWYDISGSMRSSKPLVIKLISSCKNMPQLTILFIICKFFLFLSFSCKFKMWCHAPSLQCKICRIWFEDKYKNFFVEQMQQKWIYLIITWQSKACQNVSNTDIEINIETFSSDFSSKFVKSYFYWVV